MPVAAIVAGLASFAAGATVATGIAAGALMIGGALTIAGAVTGDKTLSMIGGIFSAGGGFATLGGFGEGASAAAEGASAAEGAADTASTASSAVDAADADLGMVDTAGGWNSAEGGAGYANGAAADQGMLSTAVQPQSVPAPDVQTQPLSQASPYEPGNITQFNPPQATPPDASAFQTQAPSTMTTPTPSTASTMQTPQLATNSAFNPGSPQVSMYEPGGITQFSLPQGLPPGQSAATGWNSAEGGSGYSNGMAMDVGSTSPSATTLGGYFNNLGQWVNNNKALAEIGTKTLGGMLTRMSPSAMDQAQANYANAHADLARSTAAKTQQATDEARLRMLWRQGRIA